MEHTVWSLFPPLLTVALAIVTRRVLLALGAGILSAALLLSGGDVGATLQRVLETFSAVFWTPGEDSTGELNVWSLSVLGFLLLLGILTAFVTLTGGARAFGEWALRRVRSRRAAGALAAVLGVAIFIDDYFNALVVGQVARPVTDRHQISRAKLAYLIDSTAAPVCVVSPISSWGAYIIALIGGVLTAEGLAGSGQGALGTFLQTIPQNFYVWAALGLVAVTVWTGRDFGAMQRYEAEARGELPAGSVTSGAAPGELSAALPVSGSGRTGDLLWPIGVLTLATVGAMFWSGAAAYRAETGQAATLLQMLEYTDVAGSLLWGGVLGVLTALLRWLGHWRRGALAAGSLAQGMLEGLRAMFPAVVVLVLAWMTTDLIGQLGTGDYLAGLVQASLPAAILPALLFSLAAAMAFATGTSWGTFGLLLPIAGGLLGTAAPELLITGLAAVLAGSVMGDHCSPISDTTILSSAGAGCHHSDHVVSQLPYALVGGAITLLAYLVAGLSGQFWLGLLTVVLGLAAYSWWVGRAGQPLRG
ncbi:Na+/H+ antiporter NhaC family protein [Deinococcus sp. SL84]|uniref:Na+/H+ antiporter NhaC family protein n=1 Tax=Deinococcus sp. SL84 TaxID=2994663 RepID=UPI00227265BC|nr:Na+/H+ antiporter NhaC family protein [Deinococcus sp. SL84]MCY1704237.1 Na+/H+ antiporter NhaC family protein [Deinococcus sp. SL84]